MSHKISAVIICKNEEKRIRRCLESIKWADEIVLLDSGSTDKTLSIAKEYTNKIFVNTDWQGFGPQKRLAESHATHDWILAIDSDEVVSDELRCEILEKIKSASENDVFRFNRLTHFCGKYIKHSGWHPDRIVRLYNKKIYHYNDAFVHETVNCKGANKIDLKGTLFHYTLDSLEEYIDKRNRYAKAWAENQYEMGRRTNFIEAILHSLFAFIRHYILRLGFLDGYHGFMVSVIQMQYTFNKYNFLMFKDKV
jgi:(heptosyl)LPS beta-1,4-glucosyltransferase